MDVSFATEPAPGQLNEDHVVAAADFAMVLDGVSAPPDLETGCCHDARWLVQALGGSLATQLAMRPYASLVSVLVEAIEYVRARHGGSCDLDHPESPSTTVALVRERDGAFDYLVLCDSSVVFAGINGCWAVTDDRTSRLPAYDRATVAALRNSPHGFWVASADPSAAYHSLTGTVAQDRVRRVALCTDGASRLVEHFGRQWREVFAIADRSGPRGVIEAVREAELTAPAGARRGKVSDDATIVICQPTTIAGGGRSRATISPAVATIASRTEEGERMVRFDPVPLPACGPNRPADEVEASIVRWVNAPPLCELVAEFGGAFPSLEVGEQLEWLDRFSSEHWDFRNRSGGVERDEVVSGAFSPARVAMVRAAATALGLAEPSPPPRRRYTHLLVLGGLARACLVRTTFAAHLLDTGVVEADEVAALGSFRPLRIPEQDVLGELGFSGCLYEVDAMDMGTKAAFGFAEPVRRDESAGEVTNRSWSVHSYEAPDRPPVHVLAAPSSEPAVRRATTPDSYHFWADRVNLSSQDCVLVVTTPIYVPFQHCDAIRALGVPYGCDVDTVGFDPALISEPLLKQSFGPDRYLQEIRSAIRSMRDLLRALAEPAPA